MNYALTDGVQSSGNENYVGFVQKSHTNNVKVLSEEESNKYKCHHRIRKSCSKCRNKTPKRDCVSCTTDAVLPENSTTRLDLEDTLSTSDGEDNSLALVPVQAHQAASDSLVIQDSQCLKPGWALIRRLFLPRLQFIEKSVKKRTVFHWVLRLPSWQCSAVVYPDQKQTILYQQDNDRFSDFDGASGAILPFGYSMPSSPLSPNSGLESLPEELLNLHEKYSATCRLFSFQELLQATSNFMPGLFSFSNFFKFYDFVDF